MNNKKIEVINDEIIDKIDDKIEELRERKDSVGSSVETVVYNLRAGVGDTLLIRLNLDCHKAILELEQ